MHRFSIFAVGLCTLAGCLSGSDARASILSVTGNATLLGSPPASCVPGALTGFNAFAWNEQTNVALSLIADMTNNPGSSTAPIPGPISGLFDSHFLHFEGVAGVVGASGTVTFSAPIVAVLFRNVSLDNTDPTAGALGTIYPTGYPFRGLTSNPLSFVTINSNVLTFNLTTAVPTPFVDQVRVITKTPTPGTLSLLGLGGILCARRRRRS